MALPTRNPSTWMRSLDLPSRFSEQSGNDYELYEEDGEFVLSVEMPGFDPEEITVAWDDGMVNISAEHEDEDRGRQKTYHRRFRFPKEIEDEDIVAEYRNGILEVRLPVLEGAVARGREIPIRS